MHCNDLSKALCLLNGFANDLSHSIPNSLFLFAYDIKLFDLLNMQ